MSGSTGSPGSWPTAAASIPSHITGASAITASRFAGRVTTETVPNANDIRGAVATVAETVRAAPSAIARRTRPGLAPAKTRASGAAKSRMPTTAAKLSCQPRSPVARGSRPSVTAAASRTTYQRDRGRSARAAAIPAAPITPARWIDGPAPVTTT